MGFNPTTPRFNLTLLRFILTLPKFILTNTPHPYPPVRPHHTKLPQLPFRTLHAAHAHPKQPSQILIRQQAASSTPVPR